MSQDTPSRSELEAKIVVRAWADEDFRERLRSDPHGAVAEETGVRVPGFIEIEVLEETPERAYLVIPLNRVAIAEDELDAVSGGGGCDGGPSPY
jgi:Nitrile hydratase, alpha chain